MHIVNDYFKQNNLLFHTETLPEEIKDWFLKMQKDNRINMSDELKVFQSIIDRFGFKTIQEYADVKGLSYPGVLYQIEHNKNIPAKIGSVTFVC